MADFASLVQQSKARNALEGRDGLQNTHESEGEWVVSRPTRFVKMLHQADLSRLKQHTLQVAYTADRPGPGSAAVLAAGAELPEVNGEGGVADSDNVEDLEGDEVRDPAGVVASLTGGGSEAAASADALSLAVPAAATQGGWAGSSVRRRRTSVRRSVPRDGDPAVVVSAASTADRSAASGSSRRQPRRASHGTTQIAMAQSEDVEWLDVADEIGVYAWASGATFVGQWKNGRAHGLGCRSTEHSGCYEGLWVDGHQSGTGVFTWPDQAEYAGQWDDGVPEGLGVESEPSGEVFAGLWVNGNRGLYGVAAEPSSGRRYSGTWRLGRRDGQGIEFYSTTGGYCGLWKHGRRSGYGVRLPTTAVLQSDLNQVVVNQNSIGAYYAGQWENDMRAGYGIRVEADGTTYMGEWDNNQYHGLGMLQQGSSQRFGRFFNGHPVSWSKRSSLNRKALQAVDLAEDAAKRAWEHALVAQSRAREADHQANEAFKAARTARLVAADARKVTDRFSRLHKRYTGTTMEKQVKELAEHIESKEKKAASKGPPEQLDAAAALLAPERAVEGPPKVASSRLPRVLVGGGGDLATVLTFMPANSNLRTTADPSPQQLLIALLLAAAAAFLEFVLPQLDQ